MAATARTDSDVAPFTNEPTLDFSRSDARGEFEHALARVRGMRWRAGNRRDMGKP